MKKTFSIVLLALFCICGYAQTIDPVLLQEMRQRSDDEKIKVIVIMKSQYDRQQLNRRAAHYVTRADRREFVVNELKQFAEASQYDLRRSLDEMERNDMTTTPKIIWMANALYFSATKQAINDLAMRRDVAIIGLDEEKYALFNEESSQATTNRGITSNVTQVNADQVWDLGYTGQGVVVAVIDTGVNYNHLDLADHLWDGGAEYPHHGYDFYNNDNDPMDDHSHGTHCAGTVCGDGTAGQQTGMAPDATLMCVKVLSSGGNGYVSVTCNAMQWAVEQGCDLFSMSLGWASATITERELFRTTCMAVLDAGVVGAIAAGNEGSGNEPNNVRVPGSCPPPYMDPIQANNEGGLSCTVCVGAVDVNDNAAYFTSRGPVTWQNTTFGDYPYTYGSTTDFGLIRPDVCAPGVDIVSAYYGSNNSYTTMSGTSMATPCVAGCISLLLSKKADATPEEICQVLEETAVPLAEGKSNTYGYGRVDVLAAINALYSGPLTLESFTVNDGQGNNDGKLNAGESVSLSLTLTNESELALNGATMTLTSESEYVTITDGSESLPSFNVGQTRTINNMFAFSLSDDAPAKRNIQFLAETFVNGESVGAFRISVMVYGHTLRFNEVTVLNDNNGNGSLEAGETANLHVVISNVGNDPASSIVGTLSTSYPYLTINSAVGTFGDIEVNGQVSADFNVTLGSSAPDSYTIDLSLDLVDANNKHTDVDFELWRKPITLTSNPAGAGTLTGGGYYGQGQTCTITATPNDGYAFVKWTLNGSTVSYLPTYTFEVTDEANYVANFQAFNNSIFIGDGSTTNAYLPSYSWYNYTLSQQIYTAEELNHAACEISSVSFFNASNSSYTRKYTIYMVNTEKTTFDSNMDWITVSETDQVFSGSVTRSAGSWNTIYFDTPFNYDGTSNVALIVDDNTGSYTSTYNNRAYATESNQSIYIYSDYTNYDPYNPSNYNGTCQMVKNQIILGIPSYEYTVTITANPTEGGTVSGGGGLYYYGQPITLTATANEGYVFNSWTKNGEAVSYLSTYNLSVTESAEYVANFEQVNGIVIGDGSASNYYLPSYSTYNYTLSQQIYTADELNMEAGEISSMSFFNTGYTMTRDYNVYLVNTNKTAFESSNDWITVTENDQMFTGSVTMTKGTWTSLYFNTPFTYDGTSNLALIVDDNTGSWGSSMACRVFDAADNQAIYIYSDGTNYDPYNPSDYSGTRLSKKNQIIFGIPSYDYTVTVSANPTNGGTVSGAGLYYYGQPITLTATANPGYVFTNWTKNGEVVSYVSNYPLSVTESAEYVANFEVAPDGIVIGDGAHTNPYLPTYSYYPYTLSQQIYTTDEMGGEATEISSISFFNTGNARTRNLSIYIVHTDKMAFDSITDWITATENDLVFSGSVSMTACDWTTIYFNTPFTYDGSSNIALIVDDNTNSWYSGVSCRTFDTEASQALRISGSGTNYDPYAPTDYTGTLISEKNQIIFGIPSYDYTVTVSANPTNVGTVSGGGQCYYNQLVTLTAIANEGYIFSNWTKDGQVVSYLSHYNLTVTESAEYVANFEVAPDGIVIGDGTYTNSYLPTYYYYSLSEQIYTASEMGGVATDISSVSFFNTGTYSVTRNMNIYMVNTNKNSFGSNTDWIPVTDANMVFSGNVTMTARSWVTIYFSTPFAYDGVSNVALIVDDNSNSYNSYTNCRTFNTEASQALYINSYNTNYDPYNPTGYSGTLMSMKNQIVLGIPNYDFTVTVSANPSEGGTVSGGGGTYYYGQPITISATPAEGYVFNNWTKNGEVVSYFSTAQVSVTESAEYVANFHEVPNSIVIGDGTGTNSCLPSCAVYNYTLSQQIYTADEMGGEACEISSVSFFNTGTAKTRNYTIYMVNTEKTAFENASDWITVTETNQVFSGSFTMIAYGWTTIYFNTPFSYDGTSNLAMIVDDNTGNWSSGMTCRVSQTDVNQAIYIYSDGMNYDPFNPSVYTGTLPLVKNQVVFGKPSYGYTISATANPTNSGTVSGGGSCFYGQPVILDATSNPGYVFSNWMKNNEVLTYLSPYNFSVTESAEYVANFEVAPNGIAIGTPTYTNSYLPTYSYYPYSLTQQIYTSEEMGNNACEISSVSFFNSGYAKTRNLTVYMVNTEKTAFESNNDWIAVTEADQVFSGNVTMSAYGLATICFNTSFYYDGVSNVALIVDDNTNSWNSGLSCRTFSTTANQAIRIYGSGTNYDPSEPYGYSGTLLMVKNQVIFGYPSTITATANPTEGGTVFGSGNYAFGATCTLTATPNAGYYFLNWTEDGTVVSYDAAYSFTVEGNRNLVANFVEGSSTCVVYFDLYDSYGDGWNNNYLVIDYGNGNSEQITLRSGSFASYSREVETGSTIILSWISGYYIGECSFNIVFENDVLIYHGENINSNFQHELTINCAVANAPRIISAIADPEEGGTVEGAGTYESGTVITLTATPNESYTFMYWTENGTTVSSEASYSFLVESDRNLVAHFALPFTITATTNSFGGGNVTGGGVFDYGNSCTLTATPNQGYMFINWSKNGEVVSYNSTYSFTVTEDADFEAAFMLLEGTIVGSGETTSYYLPSYSYYYYTLSQQIYTPDEIGVAGNITSISYFNEGGTKTRTYDIYMVHTDKSTFDSNTDWITVSESDRVFSGSVTMTKGYWTTIILDTPFAYNGTSNLAIIVDDNSGNYSVSSNMACRVFNANGNQAICSYNYGTNYDPCNPSGYNGSRLTVKNQMILGFGNGIQTIALSQGWNWFSTNVDITLNDLKTALIEALPNATSITIKGKNAATTYNGTTWRGQLNTLDVTQMYKIETPTDCVITLEGLPINPSEHPVTITANAANWIAFPLSESMSLSNAFAGFAVSGDQVKGKSAAATYNGTNWRGTLNTLVPGQGYIYKSNVQVDRPFTFPISTK